MKHYPVGIADAVASNVIAFPLARVRERSANSSIKLGSSIGRFPPAKCELRKMKRAIKAFAAGGDRAPAIEVMMTLALHAKTPAVCRDAADWFFETCGMTVVDQRGGLYC